jgi:hypothetical protein
MSSPVIQIEATDVHYYSEHDEDVFFSWLAKIPCVEGHRGYLRTVYIRLACDLLREEDVRELIALYQRYNIDMGSLIALDLPEFAEWFRDKQKYWYSKIFKSRVNSTAIAEQPMIDNDT